MNEQGFRFFAAHTEPQIAPRLSWEPLLRAALITALTFRRGAPQAAHCDHHVHRRAVFQSGISASGERDCRAGSGGRKRGEPGRSRSSAGICGR